MFGSVQKYPYNLCNQLKNKNTYHIDFRQSKSMFQQARHQFQKYSKKKEKAIKFLAAVYQKLLAKFLADVYYFSLLLKLVVCLLKYVFRSPKIIMLKAFYSLKSNHIHFITYLVLTIPIPILFCRVSKLSLLLR